MDVAMKELLSNNNPDCDVIRKPSIWGLLGIGNCTKVSNIQACHTVVRDTNAETQS